MATPVRISIYDWYLIELSQSVIDNCIHRFFSQPSLREGFTQETAGYFGLGIIKSWKFPKIKKNQSWNSRPEIQKYHVNSYKKDVCDTTKDDRNLEFIKINKTSIWFLVINLECQLLQY